MHQAAGGVAGKTVAAQVRQAARHLGYSAESWRVREAWYGRAGGWSAAAVEDLRRRFAAWREKEDAREALGPTASDQGVAAVLRRLARLKREVAALEAEVSRLLAQDDGGGTP